METPPADDCCPICFSDFTFPCRTNCGHWYCASCILDYWNYSGVAIVPCKCPICTSNIDSLTPKASLHHSPEQTAFHVLDRVHRYNGLFVGRRYARIRELPLLMRRLGQHIMDPDNFVLYLSGLRCFLSIMRTVSLITSVDYGNFDWYLLILFGIIHLVGRYRRRRLLQRVRRLADPNH